MNCNFSGWSKKTGNLSGVVSQIDDGKPVVLHVVNNSSWGTAGNQHYVLVVGYKNVSGSVSLSNLIVLDPWDGKQITASTRYNRHSDGRYYVTNKVIHTCSYTKEVNATYSSKAPDNDVCHNYTYQKACSCGKVSGTKYTGLTSCTWKWVGLTYQCSVCGKEYTHGQGKTGEFVPKHNANLYSNTGLTKVVGTIPEKTVVNVSKIESNGKKWYAAVSYGGKSGYIAVSDFGPNGNAGVHNYVDGECSDCGDKQAFSEPGVYTSNKGVTLYKTDVCSSDNKTVSAGSPVTVSVLGVTTWGYWWGSTPDGYVVDMNQLTEKVSDYPYCGTASAVDEGTYVIHSASDYDLAVDVPDQSKAIRTFLQVRAEDRTVAQRFEIESNGDGTYKIRNVNSGLVVDVKTWSKLSGARIHQYTWSGDDNQRWYIEDCGDGTYAFRSKLSNLYLSIENASASSGSQLVQYTPNGGGTQRFVLEKVDSSGGLALSEYDTEITGLDESGYCYTGSAVEPVPAVRKLVWCADSLRVPKSGTGTQAGANSYTHASLSQPSVEGHKTYVVEVDRITALAGSPDQACMVAYDPKSGRALSSTCFFDVGEGRQSVIVEPEGDGILVFYCATKDASLGCASLHEGIRVYEVLDENDYALSYESNVEVGTAAVTATGAGDYAGSVNGVFSIVDPKDLFAYKISRGKVTITGLKIPEISSIVVPSEIEGCPVAVIGDSAFKGRNALVSVRIPLSVRSIGEGRLSTWPIPAR